MLIHLLSVVGFMVVSFAAQGLSHFVINKAHFEAIDFIRSDPIIPLGLLVMVIQGAVMSVALQVWRGEAATILDGVWIAAAFGLFLLSYIAIVEPSKYLVPSILAWFRVEAVVGVLQFGVFGALLGLIHQKMG